MPHSPTDLQRRWDAIRLALDAAPERDAEQVEPLKRLLNDIIQSGLATADSAERFELQWMARAVADQYTVVTGVVLTPEKVLLAGPLPTPTANPPAPRRTIPPLLLAVAAVAVIVAVGGGVLVGSATAPPAGVDQTARVKELEGQLTVASQQASTAVADRQAAEQAAKLVAAANADRERFKASAAEATKRLHDFYADTDALDAGVAAAIPEDKREAVAIDRCLAVIRQCELPSRGAFFMRNDGTVYVEPASSSRAALAVLAVHQRYPARPDREQDLALVGRWIDWYGLSQNDAGAVAVLEGSPNDVKVKPGAETYGGGGGFLMVCERYQILAGPLGDKRLTEARRAANGIVGRIDRADGLTWKDPRLPVESKEKSLLGCLEDAAGLRAAGRLLAGSDAAEYTAAADKMAKAMPDFWRGKDAADEAGVYATRQAGGSYQAETNPPNAKVNLYGLAWVDGRYAKLRERLAKQFPPQVGFDPDAPAELWLMATDDPAERSILRALCVRHALAFTRMNTYVVRPANTLLALVDGKAWLTP